MKIIACAALFFAVSASAQTVEREFKIPGSPSTQNLQEMLTVVRTVFELQNVSTDAATATLKVHGLPDQVGAVEWLIHDMEQPSDLRGRTPYEYTVSGERAPLARTYYLPAHSSPQFTQELITVIRMVPQVQRIFNYGGMDVLVVRDTKSTLDQVGWIVSQMENADPGHERFEGVTDDGTAEQIFFNQNLSPQQIMAKVTTLRTEQGIQRLFPVMARHALVVRGTPEQLAAADNLFRQPVKKLLLVGALLGIFASAASLIERQWRIPGAPSPAEMEEMASVFRTVFDVSIVRMDARSATLHVRGRAGLVEGIEWLLNDLAAPEYIRVRSPHEHRMEGEKLPEVRVFYLDPASGEARIQEVLTALRTAANVEKISSITRAKAIVMRGSDPEAGLAQWLVGELENPGNKTPGYPGVHQFRVPGTADDVARIFFSEHKDNSDFTTVAKKISASRQRVCFVPSNSALIVRGTADQIAADEKLVGVR